MTRLRTGVVVAVLGGFAALILAGTSGAAPKGQLRTFGTGEVTTANNSATILIDVGEFGGVFEQSTGQQGKLLKVAPGL